MADQKQGFGSKRKPMPKQYRGQQRVRGPVHPQAKPSGQYMAISKNPRTGKYIRTYHDNRFKAIKRLEGNRWHTNKHVYDMQDLPDGYLAVTVETPKRPKVQDYKEKEELPKFPKGYMNP